MLATGARPFAERYSAHPNSTKAHPTVTGGTSGSALLRFKLVDGRFRDAAGEDWIINMTPKLGGLPATPSDRPNSGQAVEEQTTESRICRSPWTRATSRLTTGAKLASACSVAPPLELSDEDDVTLISPRRLEPTELPRCYPEWYPPPR